MQNRDIEILLKEEMDLDYIRKWAAKLNLTDYLKRSEIEMQKEEILKYLYLNYLYLNIRSSCNTVKI
jgi:hypothetical protein